MLGFLCGMMGCFSVLRKQSLLGDAVSHAALPGILLGYLVFDSRETLALLLGALFSGLLSTYLVEWIIRNSRIKADAALSILLSVFFGLGLMLLTWIQKRPDAAQAGLTRFLFGQASTLLERDVINLAWISIPCMMVILLFWKQFQLICFDKVFANSIGIPVFWMEQLLLVLQVLVIVAGLEIAGVVLMSALLVAPAVAARQWTDRLGVMVLLAGTLGACSGVMGSFLANFFKPSLPTGPVIVMAVSLLVVASIFFASKRGLLWRYILFLKRRRHMNLESDLELLLQLDQSHLGKKEGHSLALIQKASRNPPGAAASLRVLVQMGLALEIQRNHFLPTSKATDFLSRKPQEKIQP